MRSIAPQFDPALRSLGFAAESGAAPVNRVARRFRQLFRRLRGSPPEPGNGAAEEPADIDEEIAAFKHFLSGPSERDALVPARKHRDEILGPLFDYCRARTEQFDSVFASASAFVGEWTIRDADGKITRSSLFTQDPGAIPAPAEALSFSIRFTCNLTGFQGSAASFYIRVENSLDGEGCRWLFDVVGGGWKKKKRGALGLDGLRREFDDALRIVMKKCRAAAG